MTNTYNSYYEHIVFGTKYRIPYLTKEIRNEVFAYLAASLKRHNCKVLIVGGEKEHIHILLRKNTTKDIAEVIKEIKRTSSIWLKKKGDAFRKFYWQRGYGGFSISYWDIPKIDTYIKEQEKHHQKMSWEDEYRKLLKKHGVEYDERYFLD